MCRNARLQRSVSLLPSSRHGSPRGAAFDDGPDLEEGQRGRSPGLEERHGEQLNDQAIRFYDDL